MVRPPTRDSGPWNTIVALFEGCSFRTCGVELATASFRYETATKELTSWIHVTQRWLLVVAPVPLSQLLALFSLSFPLSPPLCSFPVMPRISFPFAFLKFYSPPLSLFPRLFFFFPLFFPFDRSFLVARKSRDERPGILFIEFRSATDAFSSWKQVSGSSCVFKLDDSSLFSHDTISSRMELIGILINSYKRVDFKCYLFIFFFYLKIRILKKTSVRLRFANLNLKFTSGLNFEIQMKIKKKKNVWIYFNKFQTKKKNLPKIHFCLFTRINVTNPQKTCSRITGTGCCPFKFYSKHLPCER